MFGYYLKVTDYIQLKLPNSTRHDFRDTFYSALRKEVPLQGLYGMKVRPIVCRLPCDIVASRTWCNSQLARNGQNYLTRLSASQSYVC